MVLLSYEASDCCSIQNDFWNLKNLWERAWHEWPKMNGSHSCFQTLPFGQVCSTYTQQNWWPQTYSIGSNLKHGRLCSTKFALRQCVMSCWHCLPRQTSCPCFRRLLGNLYRVYSKDSISLPLLKVWQGYSLHPVQGDEQTAKHVGLIAITQWKEFTYHEHIIEHARIPRRIRLWTILFLLADAYFYHLGLCKLLVFSPHNQSFWNPKKRRW